MEQFQDRGVEHETRFDMSKCRRLVVERVVSSMSDKAGYARLWHQVIWQVIAQVMGATKALLQGWRFIDINKMFWGSTLCHDIEVRSNYLTETFSEGRDGALLDLKNVRCPFLLCHIFVVVVVYTPSPSMGLRINASHVCFSQKPCF